MRKFILGTLFIFTFYLTGCATIMSHGPQTLSILSQPDGADCEIVDTTTGTSVAKVKTPYTATLERGAGYFQKKYYKIRITKDGYLPENVTITPGLSGWYFANLIFGGGIGAIIVDPLTGSMWTFYEKDVFVKLYRNSPEGQSAKIEDEKAKLKTSDVKQPETHIVNLTEDKFISNIDYLKNLVIGKTTKQDVQRDLGKPIESEMGSSGKYEYWAYLYKKASSKAGPGEKASVLHKLILEFDNKGVLNDYREKVVQ